MKILFFFILTFFTFTLYANELSKDQVLSILSEMTKEGIVPKEEAPKVEAQIKALTDSQFNQIKDVARKIAAKNPEMNKETTPTLQNAANSVDTQSPEFKQASEELENILKK